MAGPAQRRRGDLLAAEHGEQRPGDQGQRQAAGQQRQHHAVAAQRPTSRRVAAAPAQRAQLAMVGLHVAIEFPGVVGDLDVDRGRP